MTKTNEYGLIVNVDKTFKIDQNGFLWSVHSSRDVVSVLYSIVHQTNQRWSFLSTIRTEESLHRSLYNDVTLHWSTQIC